MKKVVLIFFLIFCFAGYGMEIKDGFIYGANNEKIELKEYKNIIVLAPAFVEMCYMLGAEANIRAIGKTMTTPIWPKEKTVKLEDVGTITKPSLELVISKKPDLVVLNGMISDFGESLKKHKIPYITNHAESIDEILSNLIITGEILGKKNEAEKIFNEKKEKLSKIAKEISENPLNLKGAFLYSINPIMGFGKNTLSGEILTIIGIDNITNNISVARPILSPEFILKENPDFLIGAMSIKNKDDILKSNSLIMKTNAGKNGNVFLVSSEKLLRPSPRIVEEIENLYFELRKIKNSY